MIRKTLVTSIAAAVVAALLSPAVGFAATATFTAYVTQTLITGDTRWGGCMAALSVSPTTHLPLCGATWVSFSCTGDFTDPVRAYRMLDQAQLALATGKRVYVEVSDTQIANGYCFATRIDVIR